MKHLSILTLAVMALLVSACGAPAATPTINAVDVQNTAAAAAFTMVAQTQAAIPTNTPLPPTEAPTQTPLPTDTPLPLPTSAISTSDVVSTPTTVQSSSSSSGGDPCTTRVLSKPEGKETTIRVANLTKLGVTVSMYLNETASKGACGYRGFTLSKNNDIVFTDLVQGCYNLWAWSDNVKGKFTSQGAGCINNSDKWTFEIRENVIKFVGP